MNLESVEAMFEEADVLYITAKEYYEIGDNENGADFENRFMSMLNKFIQLGVDRQYMGIA